MQAAATRSANLLEVLLEETASAGYGGPATTFLTYAALNEEERETRSERSKEVSEREGRGDRESSDRQAGCQVNDGPGGHAARVGTQSRHMRPTETCEP